MTNHYRRGSEREREYAEKLEAEGWVVFRSAGSRGPVDILALKAGHVPQLIQVKANKDSPFGDFPPAERQALLDAAVKAGGEAVFVWWPFDRKGIRIVPISDWPENRSFTKYKEVEGPLATPCWIWSAKTTTNGYGKIVVEGRQRMAHRVIYERERGPVRDDLDLDHLCRNRACVNPRHLQPVTRSENLRRGERGVLTDYMLIQMLLMDATTTCSRGEVAECLAISGRTVSRYLGTAQRGRTPERQLRSVEGVVDTEHRLRSTASWWP